MLALVGGLVGLWFSVHTLYVVAMEAKTALAAGRLTLYWKIMLLPAAVLGVLLDFVFQFSFGWLMFVETPFRGGAMFSGRVQHHYSNSSGWRRKLAGFWAKNLNVFDEHIKP